MHYTNSQSFCTHLLCTYVFRIIGHKYIKYMSVYLYGVFSGMCVQGFASGLWRENSVCLIVDFTYCSGPRLCLIMLFVAPWCVSRGKTCCCSSSMIRVT